MFHQVEVYVHMYTAYRNIYLVYSLEYCQKNLDLEHLCSSPWAMLNVFVSASNMVEPPFGSL